VSSKIWAVAARNRSVGSGWSKGNWLATVQSIRESQVTKTQGIDFKELKPHAVEMTGRKVSFLSPWKAQPTRFPHFHRIGCCLFYLKKRMSVS
jgi:hypothetical protein